MNVPIIRAAGPGDRKKSKDEMLEDCIHQIRWLTDTLFGQRNREGKLIKDDTGIPAIGLLQKFEGYWEFDEEKKEPVLMQDGMEQMYKKLADSHNILSQVLMGELTQLKVQQVVIFLQLGIKPDQLAEMLEAKEKEINIWMQNFNSAIKQKMAKLEKEEKERKAKDQTKAEELKKMGVVPAEEKKDDKN
jgi:hypothetical protein